MCKACNTSWSWMVLPLPQFIMKPVVGGRNDTQHWEVVSFAHYNGLGLHITMT